MPDPREVLAAALAEQSPDDDDLRDWLTDRAEFVEDALAAAGLHVCAEGQAVVDGRVVTLPVQSIRHLFDVFIEGGWVEDEDIDHIDAVASMFDLLAGEAPDAR